MLLSKNHWSSWYRQYPWLTAFLHLVYGDTYQALCVPDTVSGMKWTVGHRTDMVWPFWSSKHSSISSRSWLTLELVLPKISSGSNWVGFVLDSSLSQAELDKPDSKRQLDEVIYGFLGTWDDVFGRSPLSCHSPPPQTFRTALSSCISRQNLTRHPQHLIYTEFATDT